MAQIDVPLTEEADGLVGPARIAINRKTARIHDPETARRLGFRGAPVGGSACTSTCLRRCWCVFLAMRGSNAVRFPSTS